MFVRLSRRFRRPTRARGLLAACLALVSQLALGAVVLGDAAPPPELAALQAVTILCDTGGGDRAPAPHQAPDQALCPLSVTLALPSVIPVPEALLPASPPSLALGPGRPPPARAPPAPTRLVAFPRGPPGPA